MKVENRDYAGLGDPEPEPNYGQNAALGRKPYARTDARKPTDPPMEDLIKRVTQLHERMVSDMAAVTAKLNDHADRVYGPDTDADNQKAAGLMTGESGSPAALPRLYDAIRSMEDQCGHFMRTLQQAADRNCRLA